MLLLTLNDSIHLNMNVLIYIKLHHCKTPQIKLKAWDTRGQTSAVWNKASVFEVFSVQW